MAISQANEGFFDLDTETKVICKQICILLVAKGAVKSPKEEEDCWQASFDFLATTFVDLSID